MNYKYFLKGLETDDHHRFFEDILKFSEFQLESVHNYIQEVFPTDEQSDFSSIKPITEKELEEIRLDKTIQNNIHLMYLRMLEFWKLDGDKYKDWGFLKPVRLWNIKNNHNHRRISRVIKSLKLCGLTQDYEDFKMRLEYIIELRKTNTHIHITDNTISYWQKYMTEEIDN